MRIVLASLILLSGFTSSSAGDFRLYPGLIDPDAFIQMTNDKGLTVEITLKCERPGKRPVAGVMVYSKVENVYCSSKWLCTKDALEAAEDTCGY